VTAFHVWNGVYPTFAAAKEVGPGFDGEIWRDRSLQAARDTLALVGSGQPLDYALRQRNALLPVLTASVLATQPRASILDFGGGLGTGFMVLADGIADAAAKIDYAVVEVDSICRAGNDLFAGKSGPKFLSELPAAGSYDIVLAASVMQYIEDWQNVVARLAGYGARYLLFADMFVGSFPGFVTLQTYYGSLIRHWFFNDREFIDAVERHGYRLALRSTADAKILGAYGPLPMDNLPPDRRVPHASHLLFQRASAS
jgi:putative methyltransferase (TIGR04325 family)